MGNGADCCITLKQTATQRLLNTSTCALERAARPVSQRGLQ